MTIATWQQAAIALAEQRGLPELKPLLEGLALATAALRAANFTPQASGARPAASPATADPPQSGAGLPPDPLPR